VPESALDVQAMLAGRAALLRDACERGVAYLDGVADRPVTPGKLAVNGLPELGFPLPERGLGGTQALRLLDELGSPATVASNGPRYFGFVTGGALPAAQAAAWLSAAWDQNAALSVMSPVAARCGEVAIGWISDLLGLPAGTGGGFVTGASMANATCLAAARDAVLTAHGWDAAGQGLVGAPPVTVVVGAEVHTTIRKALGIIGLGRDRAIVLPADGQGRIDVRDLPQLSGGPAIVCLQAGNVNTGASDPLGPLTEWAAKYRAWVHVDGAFGLWAAASPTTRPQVAFVELADSWATDCHKWLNTTYDCGLALVSDPETLRRAMEATASYLPGSGAEAMGLTPQSSQRARGVEVWAALASLGRDGVAELVDRCCRLARRFADGMRSPGFEVLNDVVLNQVLVSFGSAQRTDSVIAAVQEDGTCWCGPTTWHGHRAMRISVSGWSTTEDDIDRSIAAVRACALQPT
jgi:glutamate/tyrosine decarboxylase-like PLP-dependent enzyme